MKTARILKRRRLTSLGRLLGNPGFALCIMGVMGGACSNSQNHDPLARVEQEATAPSGSVLINEVLYDPKGTSAADAAYQYIEISGPAGDTLDGYYVAIVDGSAAGAGDVLAVVNLGTACSGGPCALGSDGLLMITPSLTAGQTVPSGTTHVASGYTMVNTTNATPTTGDPKNDISILVIESPTTAITTSTNLASDGGTLALPAGATLVDGIGWSEDPAGKVFGTDVKPLANGAAGQDSPSAIVRISTCTTANHAACWFYGEFANTGSGSTTAMTGITASVTGTTLPTGVTELTPGAPNVAGTTNDAGVGGGTSTGGATGQGGSTTTVAGGTTGAGGTTAVSTTGTKAAGGATSTLPTCSGSSAQVQGTACTAGDACRTNTHTCTCAANNTYDCVSTSGTGGSTSIGGTTAVSTAATTPAGGTTAVSTATAPAGGTTAVSTATAPAGGTTAVSTATTPVGGTTAVATTGTSAAGGSTAASTTGTKATGGASTASTGTKATGGKTGTSTSGTKTGGATAVGTANTATASEGDDSGCGCRTAGRSQLPASGLAFMAALAGGLLARRRRRN